MGSWNQIIAGVAFIAAILVVDGYLLVEQFVQPADMVWIEAGQFTMGSDSGLPDEKPAHPVSLRGFWIDKFEVTNNDFAEFVSATGYQTRSEQVADSLVFKTPEDNGQPLRGPLDWWHLVPHADWQHPLGPADTIADKGEHPVVQVSYDDALAYCSWAGKELPTEAQFEFAARGGREGETYSWGSSPLHLTASVSNTWQGTFPLEDKGSDGYVTTAPVGSFPPNGYGLHDISGNVWEWVSDWYHPQYYQDSPGRNPTGVRQQDSFDPNEPGVAKRSIRGGSFLCSDNFCQGFRVSARMPAEPGSSTNHTGFRCVINRARP